MRIEEVVGKEVVGSQGWKIGTAKDIIFEPNTWKIASVDVELRKDVAKELKVKHFLRKAHIPINTSYIQGIGDHIILNASRDQMARMITTQDLQDKTLVNNA